LFKGAFGVLGFHDVGRVWMKDDSSKTWHRGYGGGIWVAPFNKIVLTAAITASDEEKRFPMASIGFQF
jgi:outer membrane translocation and assembly module TamA